MDSFFSRPLAEPPRRIWTHEEKLELFRRKGDGFSLYKLAEMYGVPPYEIREALQEIGQEMTALQPTRGVYKHFEGYHRPPGSAMPKAPRRRPLEDYFNDVLQ